MDIFISKKMRNFILLAQTNNIARAAEKIHMTASPFGKSIAALEEQIGYTLFTRKDNNISLNKAVRLLRSIRLSIALLHGQTFLRAGFHAAPALDAAESFDFPQLGGPVHGNGPRGAFPGAEAAEYTGIYIDFHMPSRPVGILPWLLRIRSCCRLAEQVLQSHACKFHCVHLLHCITLLPLRQRSVQLMQGSIVRIRIGTSAS